MTPETLVAPELKETVEESKETEHLLHRNGNRGSQSTQPVFSTAEIEKLNEVELKAAIRSAWKMHEHVVKKDMAPLLFWLRLKLRVQGSRNDIHDKDRGFGAWVDENLDITRRTADRWADKYGLDNGLMERKPTSGQSSKGEDPDDGGVEEHGQGFTYFVSQPLHKQYEKALKTIKEHFKITDNGKAVVKGVVYAAEAIATVLPAGNRRKRSSTTGRRRG
jgi:hypothetical protein